MMIQEPRCLLTLLCSALLCQVQLKVTLDDSSKFFGAAFTSISMVVFISLPLTSTVFANKP